MKGKDILVMGVYTAVSIFFAKVNIYVCVGWLAWTIGACYYELRRKQEEKL